jgi:UDP-N-acetylglucosamine--N-acetylmuramyl-(pentapeptide) pyrophosphoryl-undecaprenol N-acetylglucosamine transferase
LKIIVTGGGTGGHVSPAVAVITRLRERASQEAWPLELLYIGSVAGVERRTMLEMGVPYVAIQTGKLRRYLSPQTPIDLLFRLPLGGVQALRAVRRFRPDAIFSTGGYVCVPTVAAGRLMAVPSLTHEQTALVGLANRVAGRFATRIAVSYPQSARYFPPGKTIITGNPMRPSILNGDGRHAAALLGFDPTVPTLYVTGGAQGSHAINMAVHAALPRLLECCQVVHQCGQGPDGSGADLRMLEQAREELPAELQARYRVQAYVGDELGDIYALVSLVVGRAGAGTVNELANLGKPSILVPLPGAAGGEQEANARALEKEGGAITLLESDLTPDSLVEMVCSLIRDEERLAGMRAGASRLSTAGAADKIVDELLRLAGRDKAAGKVPNAGQ